MFDIEGLTGFFFFFKTSLQLYCLRTEHSFIILLKQGPDDWSFL